MHGPPGDDLFIKLDVALIRANEARDHVEGSGFSRAVWTEQANDFAGCEFDTYIVDDAPLFINLDQVVGTNFHLVGSTAGFYVDFRGISAGPIFEGFHIVVNKNINCLALTVGLVIESTARDFYVTDEEDFALGVHGQAITFGMEVDWVAFFVTSVEVDFDAAPDVCAGYGPGV